MSGFENIRREENVSGQDEVWRMKGSDRQYGLFDMNSLNPVPELKRAMNVAARKCGLSREEIVERLNELAALEGLRTRGKDGKLTLAVLDKWLAPESDQVIGLKWLPGYCKVVGSLSPVAALVKPLGSAVINGADRILLEAAKIQLQEKAARKKSRRLMEQYQEMMGESGL